MTFDLTYYSLYVAQSKFATQYFYLVRMFNFYLPVYDYKSVRYAFLKNTPGNFKFYISFNNLKNIFLSRYFDFKIITEI